MNTTKKYDLYTTTSVGAVGHMIEFAALPTAIQATLVVVLVLVEAIALYVGYGLLENKLAPPVLEAIANA